MGKPIYLGKGTVISSRDILGIFDFETSTIMKSTREYLKKGEILGEIENVSSDIPSCFMVCVSKNCGRKIYLCGKVKISC